MKPTDGNDLIAAIQEFEAALPGWWWSIGSCGRAMLVAGRTVGAVMLIP
jgi:hypothetical protein